MAKTILFDFDGTIANTVEVGVSVFNELARTYGFLEITEANAVALRDGGPRTAMKILSIPMLKVPTVLRGLRKGITLALPTLVATQGMQPIVSSLRKRGYQLGIVTSNSEKNVRAFLANNDMDFFHFIQAGSGIFNKASRIKKLMVREKLKSDETIFVGDEIRDIEAARKNKLVSVGVTWGLNSREGIETAKPNFVVDTGRELLELFSGAVLSGVSPD